MSFQKLLRKVERAEISLEARERQVAADLRQFKLSWREAWTPGRIVVAGLASGYLVGRRERSGGGDGSSSVLRLITALSTLLAGSRVRAAADDAENAARMAEQSTDSGAESLLADITEP